MGSNSEDAALKAYPKCETVPCHEFEDAFQVSTVVNVTVCGLKLEYHANSETLFKCLCSINGTIFTFTFEVLNVCRQQSDLLNYFVPSAFSIAGS